MIFIISRICNVINKQKYGKLNRTIVNKSGYKTFTNDKEAKVWGMNHYKDWAENYKIIMKNAKRAKNSSLLNIPIECYCGNSYSQINEYLRFEESDGHSIYSELANILIVLLASATKIPCDLVVYRMVCDEFIQELVEKNKLEIPTPAHEKGFISTSLLKDIAKQQESYANHNNMLKIYVRKGSIGVYVNSITTRGEEEMLLFPNGYFHLIQYPYWDAEVEKTIYECDLFYFDF